MGTEGHQPRADFYGESQRSDPVASKDLGGFTAHNNCLGTIHMGGFDAFMTQPQVNGSDINPSLEQVDGGTVSLMSLAALDVKILS